MCRLLLIKSKNSFDIKNQLKKFSRVAHSSPEYQGNGWGCAYISGDSWKLYKDLIPIWEDDLGQFGHTTLLIAHARSAGDDEPIAIECNMPYNHNNFMYVFNGFLKGVRLPADGVIGSEKVFNYILRFHNSDLFEAFSRGLEIIRKRSEYIKALNIVMTDKEQVCVCSIYSENKDYYTLFSKTSNDTLMICSAPFPGENDWAAIKNNTVTQFDFP